MIKNILGTTLTRLIAMAISFVVLVLNARFLGSSAVGTISLIVLAVTLNVMLSNFIGGNALVYLIPRFPLMTLVFPSACWALLSAFVGTIILSYFYLIPEGFKTWVLVLSALYSLAMINLIILLGKEKIKVYNLLNLLQFLVLIVAIAIFYFSMPHPGINQYLIALGLSYLIMLVFSTIAVFPFLSRGRLFDSNVFKQVFRLGAFVQFANILQLLNYRLAYYFVEFFLGRAQLGIFDVGNKLSEGLWLTSRSIATVQGSRISNSNNKDYSIRLTLSLLKISLIITFFGLALLMYLPSEFYEWMFGKDFSSTTWVLVGLSLGILSVTVTALLSSYFSGIGKHYVNTIGSAIGFCAIIPAGILLIPRYGIIGAGFSASVSYFLSSVWAIIYFKREAGIKYRAFLLRSADWDLFKETLFFIMKRKK